MSDDTDAKYDASFRQIVSEYRDKVADLKAQLAASEAARGRMREALQRFWDVVDLDGCPDDIIMAVEEALAEPKEGVNRG